MSIRIPELPDDPSWVTRKSGIHGTGVFACKAIQRGEWIAEYTGERISSEEAFLRSVTRDADHTVLFILTDDVYVDGSKSNNGTRFINHSCEPNLAAYEIRCRLFFVALRNINPDEELTFDYGLENVTRKQKAYHVCRCGTPSCRGTMVAPTKKGKAK